MTLHIPIASRAPAYAQWRANSVSAAPEHIAMVAAYRSVGGLVTGDRAATLLGIYRAQPISQLARWIIARHIVSFDWEGDRLVPLFQFEQPGMYLRNRVKAVLAELVDTEDDMGVAAWFTRPNAWLDGEVPLVMIEIDPESVMVAARGDRYLSRS